MYSTLSKVRWSTTYFDSLAAVSQKFEKWQKHFTHPIHTHARWRTWTETCWNESPLQTTGMFDSSLLNALLRKSKMSMEHNHRITVVSPKRWGSYRQNKQVIPHWQWSNLLVAYLDWKKLEDWAGAWQWRFLEGGGSPYISHFCRYVQKILVINNQHIISCIYWKMQLLSWSLYRESDMSAKYLNPGTLIWTLDTRGIHPKKLRTNLHRRPSMTFQDSETYQVGR